ncbi:hypothetical protein ACLKA6_011949 [Drosophila palustris]
MLGTQDNSRRALLSDDRPTPPYPASRCTLGGVRVKWLSVSTQVSGCPRHLAACQPRDEELVGVGGQTTHYLSCKHLIIFCTFVVFREC